MIKFWLPVLFCVLTIGVKAQDKQVEGIVFDLTTKERIARVNVLNSRTGHSIYNNLKAEFKITARLGDLLIFSKQGYTNDTIKVQAANVLAVYLKSSGIMLKEVTIKDSLLSPQKRLVATQKEYNKAYGSLANRDVLTVGPMGAGIGIDALWNMVSRSGRNAQKLQGIIERDYQQNVIDYRFNKTLVAGVTGLKDPQLTDFMRKYRPGYYMVISASDYDFISSIRANLRRYSRNPNAYTLPALTP